MLSNKQLRGQYFTTSNPFIGKAFDVWDNLRPSAVVLEPFAGAKHICGYFDDVFDCYDIEPQSADIIQRDTIRDFPQGYEICITNPPYLAKNSVRRRGETPHFRYEDLYLDCLELMLANCGYIAAVVPSTFYNTGMFRDRLLCWDKIDHVLFSDTDCPAGVAYFVPDCVETRLFVDGQEIEPERQKPSLSTVKFNVPYGQYVLTGIDKISGRSIGISPVDESFDREKYLKPTSRNYVLFYSSKELDCSRVNREINLWRDRTKDFYLSSFKSEMKCGVYRKRMSFSDLKLFL